MSVILLNCCATNNIKPFKAGQNIEPETEGEKRLWHAARKAETALIKSKRIHHDPPLRSYLQGVMDRLYPEFKGKIRIEILKNPNFNAFALSNGSVYVSMGLLAALDNEAQLAMVLAHEGIHFINKHAAIGKAYGSLRYSQQHEKEADMLGWQRLLAAGYDVRQAPETFRYISVEEKVYKYVEPGTSSSHPPTKERIKYFRSLNASIAHHSNKVAAASYQQHVAGLRQNVLKEKIIAGQYNEIIAVLTEEDLALRYGDLGRFYLAEAYRLRNKDGDYQKAIVAYQSVVNTCPDFAPAYRSLGMIHLKSKHYQEAIEKLERYLALQPEAEDRAFVKQYLKKARNGDNDS